MATVPPDMLQAARDLKVHLAKLIGVIDQVEHQLNLGELDAARKIVADLVADKEFTGSADKIARSLVAYLTKE